MLTSSPLSRFLNSPIFFDADPGASGGGNNPPVEPPKPKQSDIDTAVAARIAELLGAKSVANDPFEALKISMKAQHRLEVENERLKGEIGKLPADVQAELEAYRALGKPDAVKAAIETGTVAQQKAAALEQEKVLGDAAGVLKLQGNALFKSLLKDVPLKIEGEGEARKVLVTAADGRAVDFEEYARTRPELMDALPMLQANGQQQNGATGGTRWAGGSASGGTPQPNKYEAIRQEVKAKTEQQKPEQRDLTRAGIH